MNDPRKHDRNDRAWHAQWALTHHYFWLPCPTCGRYFGGHEAGSGSVMTPEKGPGRAMSICSWCNEAGVGRPVTKTGVPVPIV